jgi:hypothetical protein
MEMLDRVMAMQAGISELTESTAQLPGYAESTRAAEAVNRKLMYQCFDTFKHVLPVAEGPSPSTGFRVDMRILESTCTRLNHLPSSTSAQPTTIEGLRVLPRLLTQINEHSFNSNAGLKSKIDALQKTVNQLDAVQGVEFRVTSAQAMREATDALRWMEQNMSSRLPPTTTPTTTPTTQPEMKHPAPTTQPSTPQ